MHADNTGVCGIFFRGVPPKDSHVPLSLRQARQLSGQLEIEAGDNEALRTRLRAMQEESDTRLAVL